MNKLLIICGPTATGKTKLGIELAKKFDGEIVSADSRQIYRGMDIGTGKDLPVSAKFKVQSPVPSGTGQSAKSQFKVKSFRIGYYDCDNVPLWLLDIVEPDYRFNVADYKKCAELVIKDILKRGKLPIIVGGTGFYIKAVTDEIETIGIEPDWQLREKLQSCKVSELQRILDELDSESLDSARGKLRRRMNESDRQNPRRLIRAIEIAQKIKNQKPALSEVEGSKIKSTSQKSNLDTLFVGLKVPNEILYQRIDQRVEERVGEGIEKEIKTLLGKGYNWENSALGTTIAYKEWKNYFDENVGAQRDAPVQKWKFDEHDYSRRQRTWFKKDERINWFDISQKNYILGVEKLVGSWYIKDSSKFKVQGSKL